MTKPSGLRGHTSGALFEVRRVLTPTEILDSNSSAVVLVAGVADTIYIPRSCRSVYRAGTAAYGGVSPGTFAVQPSGSSVLVMLVEPGIDQSDDQVGVASPLATGNEQTILAVGADLVFWNTASNPNCFGPILSTILASGGADWNPGDEALVFAGDGNAFITIDTVDGDGAVLTYHVTDPGTGYQNALAVETLPNGETVIGSGFTVNVVIDAGTLTVTVEYDVVDVS